jgi:hypothetical protein
MAAVTFASTLGATGARAQGDPAEAAREWLADCRDNDRGDQERFCEVRVLGWRASGRTITVDGGTNGGIAVHGWNRDSVHVVAKIQAQARSESAARELAQGIAIESGAALRADGPSRRWTRREGWSVSFELWAPARSDLDLEAHNGGVAVADVTGRMTLRTVNGPISLRRVAGDVRGQATNGPLTIALEGARWEGPGLDVETTNGPVDLTLPADYSAHLETGTVNGPMRIDFPITVQGRINFRRIATDIGSGGATIRAITTNGPVTIRRR